MWQSERKEKPKDFIFRTKFNMLELIVRNKIINNKKEESRLNRVTES